MSRSRGAMIGLLLVILGAWGALIPFVGPHFDFAYTPGNAWMAARGWLEVIPGATTIVGGLLLIASRSRAIAMLGGLLAAVAGAWFVVGGTFAPVLGIGSVGDPLAMTERKRAVLEVAYFSGVGVLIAFLAGAALARLAVRLPREARPVAAPATPAPTPAAEPYSGLVEPDADTAAALTQPRAEQVKPSGLGHFRRHRAGVN